MPLGIFHQGLSVILRELMSPGEFYFNQSVINTAVLWDTNGSSNSSMVTFQIARLSKHFSNQP